VVPWRDWGEWEEVRGGLMGADAAAAARAVGRVRAWQSRGKVPHSVEATAALVEIGLARAGEGGGGRSENEIRLMYSMALVRLVNGIVDAVQQKKFAAPVSDLAGKVALPRVLVDIRHTASHNALPTLPALSLAAARALEWLGQHYWVPQAAALQSGPVNSIGPLLRQLVHVKSQLLAAHRVREARVLQAHAQTDEHEETMREEKRVKREARAGVLVGAILGTHKQKDYTTTHTHTHTHNTHTHIHK
jgi:hypothetical protein